METHILSIYGDPHFVYGEIPHLSLLLLLVLFRPTHPPVISTEAVHSLTVNSAAERPPYFVFTIAGLESALSPTQPLPEISHHAFREYTLPSQRSNFINRPI
jgi:hypothetical protein